MLACDVEGCGEPAVSSVLSVCMVNMPPLEPDLCDNHLLEARTVIVHLLAGVFTYNATQPDEEAE